MRETLEDVRVWSTGCPSWSYERVSLLGSVPVFVRAQPPLSQYTKHPEENDTRSQMFSVDLVSLVSGDDLSYYSRRYSIVYGHQSCMDLFLPSSHEKSLPACDANCVPDEKRTSTGIVCVRRCSSEVKIFPQKKRMNRMTFLRFNQYRKTVVMLDNRI